MVVMTARSEDEYFVRRHQRRTSDPAAAEDIAYRCAESCSASRTTGTNLGFYDLL